MAYCGKCGHLNDDNASFCGGCGAPLKQTEPVTDFHQGDAFAEEQTIVQQPVQQPVQRPVQQEYSGYPIPPQPEQPKKKSGWKSCFVVGCWFYLICAIIVAAVVGYVIWELSKDDKEHVKKESIERELPDSLSMNVVEYDGVPLAEFAADKGFPVVDENVFPVNGAKYELDDDVLELTLQFDINNADEAGMMTASDGKKILDLPVKAIGNSMLEIRHPETDEVLGFVFTRPDRHGLLLNDGEIRQLTLK